MATKLPLQVVASKALASGTAAGAVAAAANGETSGTAAGTAAGTGLDDVEIYAEISSLVRLNLLSQTAMDLDQVKLRCLAATGETAESRRWARI